MPSPIALLRFRSKVNDDLFTQKTLIRFTQSAKRAVVPGKVIRRLPSTGLWKVETDRGGVIEAKSQTSSNLEGKFVNVSMGDHFGQITSIPGFLK